MASSPAWPVKRRRAGRLSMRSEVRGAEVLRQAFRRWGRRAYAALGSALYIEAQGIMTESKREVPVKTGALRGSGQVDLPVDEGRRWRVRLGYGDQSVGYAVHVHERLDTFHPVGKAKYLEDPLQRAAPGLPRRLAIHIKRMVRS